MMHVAEIHKKIIDIYNSIEYRELSDYYSKKNFFSLFCKDRDELLHSNFLAWFLNEKGSHGLQTYPIRKFLQMLLVAKGEHCNSDSAFSEQLAHIILSDDYTISNVKVEREKEIEYGRLDVFIEFTLTERDKKYVIRIITENKVYSSEHNVSAVGKAQSDSYYDWALKTYPSSSDEYILFVYLSPRSKLELRNLNNKDCSNSNFIQVNYQYLIDYVYTPCILSDISDESKFIINNYIRCLSFPSLGDGSTFEGVKIMAYSAEEKELLFKFWDNNKELIIAAVSALKSDPDIDLSDDQRTAIDAAVNILGKTNKRDITKYKFDGQGEFPANRLVLAVVKDYIENHPDITYDNLKEVFPDGIQGSFGVFKRVSELTDVDRGINRSNQRSNFFEKENETLKVDGELIAVCNQWGKTGTNTNLLRFFSHIESFGYKDRIQEV